jgi:hypothetical protein
MNVYSYLDEKGLTKASDCLLKTAMDLSFLPESNEGGVIGTYHSKFDKDTKKKFKKEFGYEPGKLGVKKFYNLPAEFIIEENLTLFYIAPYVQQNTDFLMPQPSSKISFTSLIANKILLSERLEGYKINFLCSRQNFFSHDVLAEIIEDTTTARIVDKLNSIGIFWYDCHKENYLIDKSNAHKIYDLVKLALDKNNNYEKLFNEILSDNEEAQDDDYNTVEETDENEEKFLNFIPSLKINEISNTEIRSIIKPAVDGRFLETLNPDLFDFSSKAKLVDLGSFRCKSDTEPAKKLIELENTLNVSRYANNKFVQIICETIDRLIK